MRQPPPNALELPLEERAELAMRAAYERLIEEHARQGLPIFVWRDGKVLEIPPDELRARIAGASSDQRPPIR